MNIVTYVILYFVSIVWIITGTSTIIYTDQTRKLLFKKALYLDNVTVLSLIGVILGVILIAGGFFARDVLWLALILGILAVGKGVYFFKASPDQMARIFDWWYEGAGGETIRFWGLIVLFLGILMLSYIL